MEIVLVTGLDILSRMKGRRTGGQVYIGWVRNTEPPHQI